MTPERAINTSRVIGGVVIELAPSVDALIKGIENTAKQLFKSWDEGNKTQELELMKESDYPGSIIEPVMLVVAPIEIDAYASTGRGCYTHIPEVGWQKRDNITFKDVKNRIPNKKLYELLDLYMVNEIDIARVLQEFIDGAYLRQRLISHAERPELEEDALGVMRSNNRVIVNHELILRLGDL